jgi:TolB-like protein/Tfp pilus assembly protein PilF
MTLSAGDRLGRYEIQGDLGAGGMGEVYRALDKDLDREVAIKVLPEAVSGDSARLERFKREAKAVAKLSHNNILEIHDFGTQEQTAYAVTELLDGQDLGAYLQSHAGPLSWKEIQRIGTAVSDGLAAAHDKGIVHRDLKPSNIMLCTDGRVKILDFGLARVREELDSEGETASELPATTPGTVMGTVGYMAPEQVQGKAADAQSDIFALGCVLYEMLTGKRAFKRDTSAETMTAILREEPPSFADSGIAVSPEIADTVERCLEKEPQRRFQSASDLSFALRSVAGDSSVSAAAPMPRAGGIRRWLPWAAAATLIVAAGWIVLTLRPEPKPPVATEMSIRSLAVLPLQNLSGDPDQEYLADGMTESLITDLSKVGDLKVISRTSVMRFKNTETPVPEIARELGVDGIVEGSVIREGDRIRVTAQLIEAETDRHLWAESYERDLTSVLAIQGEVARQVAGAIQVELTPLETERLTTTRTVNKETYELYLRGMYELNKPGREAVENGLALLHQAVENDPVDPLAYEGLAEGYVTLGHGVQARRDYFPRAKAAAMRALELDPYSARAQSVLADVAVYYEWDWATAEKMFQRAFELDPNVAMTHYHYSWFLAQQRRFSEAIAEHKRARELDPLAPGHTLWLGWLYAYEARYDEAMEEVRKGRELSPDNPLAAMVASTVLSATGEHARAVEEARKLAEVRPLRFILARAHAFAGHENEAREVLAELESKEWTVWNGFTVPSVYVALGDFDAAFEALERAYEMRSPWLPWIGVEILYAPLRGDPRLDDLLRRMNSPLAEEAAG